MLLITSGYKTETFPSVIFRVPTAQYSLALLCTSRCCNTNCKDKKFMSFSVSYMTIFKDFYLSSSGSRQFITSTLHRFKSREWELSNVSKQFSDETRSMTWKFLFSSSSHVAPLHHPSPVARTEAQCKNSSLSSGISSVSQMSCRASPALPVNH